MATYAYVYSRSLALDSVKNEVRIIARIIVSAILDFPMLFKVFIVFIVFNHDQGIISQKNRVLNVQSRPTCEIVWTKVQTVSLTKQAHCFLRHGYHKAFIINPNTFLSANHW